MRDLTHDHKRNGITTLFAALVDRSGARASARLISN
jgi:hypothetical protein